MVAENLRVVRQQREKQAEDADRLARLRAEEDRLKREEEVHRGTGVHDQFNS